MKNKIFIGIFILIAVTISIYNINLKSQDANLVSLSSANIEALANDNESDSSKEKCSQKTEDKADPMNGTRCSDRDRNSSVQAYWKIYTCVKGSGSNCKVGTVYTGNDCNTDFDGSESGLKVVCP